MSPNCNLVGPQRIRKEYFAAHLPRCPRGASPRGFFVPKSEAAAPLTGPKSRFTTNHEQARNPIIQENLSMMLLALMAEADAQLEGLLA